MLDVDDRAVADVDDLLLSGSDLDEDDAKSGKNIFICVGERLKGQLPLSL